MHYSTRQKHIITIAVVIDVLLFYSVLPDPEGRSLPDYYVIILLRLNLLQVTGGMLSMIPAHRIACKVRQTTIRFRMLLLKTMAFNLFINMVVIEDQLLRGMYK